MRSLIAAALVAPVGQFCDRILRGVAQVMLQNNRATGLLFLVGIFVGDWIAGLYALLGTVVSTETARLFGAPQYAVRQGLCGFNGALVGLGLSYYLGHDAILPVLVIIVSMFATVVQAAVKNLAGMQGHTLTSSFVIVTWIFREGRYRCGARSSQKESSDQIEMSAQRSRAQVTIHRQSRWLSRSRAPQRGLFATEHQELATLTSLL